MRLIIPLPLACRLSARDSLRCKRWRECHPFRSDRERLCRVRPAEALRLLKAPASWAVLSVEGINRHRTRQPAPRRSGSSRGGSLNGLRAAASASSTRSGARQSSHSGQGVAAMESGLTGYKLESAATGAKLSSARAKAGLSEEKEARSGSGSAAGSGAYANGFPDSTKNMAVINPPDLANVSLFSFSPGNL